MKAQFKILTSIALVALISLGAIGVAQTTGGGGDAPKKVEKKIEIVEENGVKTMTVTTTTDGISAVETFSGDEVDAYLRKEGGTRQHDDHVNMWFGDDMNGAMKIHIETDEDGNVTSQDIDIEKLLEGIDMNFLSGLEGLEGMEDIDKEELQKLIEESMSELKDLNLDFDISTNEDGVFVFETNVDDDGNGHTARTRVVISGDESGVNTWSNGDGTMTIDIDEEIDGENVTKTMVFISNSCHIEDIDETEAKDLGVEDNNNDLKINELKFYPNPTKGQFTLEFEVPESGTTEITITDIEGKQVYKEKVKGAGTHTQQIDISNESKGIYLLNLRQGKKSTVKKIVLD